MIRMTSLLTLLACFGIASPGLGEPPKKPLVRPLISWKRGVEDGARDGVCPPPFHNFVLYQLHVGTFFTPHLPARGGTFLDATRSGTVPAPRPCPPPNPGGPGRHGRTPPRGPGGGSAWSIPGTAPPASSP